MFTNISKMRNKSEKDILQKELEFYTNLLSQHEKNKEKNFNVPYTSSAKTFMKKPSSTYSSQSSKPNGIFTFNKSSKIDIKTIKRDHATINTNKYSYPKGRSTSSLQSPKTQHVPNRNSLSTSRIIFSKHNTPPLASKTISHSKSIKSNYGKYNSVIDHGKKLAASDTKVFNKLLMKKETPASSHSKIVINKEASVQSSSKVFIDKRASVQSSSKVFMNKEASAKSSSQMLMNKEASSQLGSKVLMNKEASVQLGSKVLMNKETSPQLGSKVLMNKEASAQSGSKVLMNEETHAMPDSKVLIYKETFSKLDSRALMGEIAAVTKQLKIKSGNSSDPSAKLLKSQSRFKKINSAVKMEEKIDVPKAEILQNNKESSKADNNSCTSLYKAAATKCENMLKLPSKHDQFAENSALCQKDNGKMHLILIEKLNAVEKLLSATTKNSSKVLNKVEKYPTRREVRLNSNISPGFENFKSSKVNTFVDLNRKNSAANNKFLRKQSFRLNKNSSANNSLIRKNHRVVKFNQTPKLKLSPASKEMKLLPKSVNLVKTKYKVINESQLRRLSMNSKGDGVTLGSTKKNCNTNVQKNSYRLVNNHKTNLKSAKVPKRLFAKDVHRGSYSLTRNTCSPLKKLPNKVFKKYSPFPYRSSLKHKQNLNESYKLSRSLSEDDMKSPSESSGFDVDLLLELAAENKDKLSKSVARKRLYKSKSRLVNSYSVQARTAKMIKTKYFNPYRKSVDSKALLYTNKSFKGYKSNYASSLLKSSKSFSLKLESRKCNQKKIVYRGGEKFIIGSTGRTLKKLPNQSTKTRKISIFRNSFNGKSVIKTPNPVSKMIASRALNRSINRALSASTKKKMRKINTYCMFYNRFGRCNKGIKCPFVHDPSKIAVCTRFLRGTCKSDGCLFSHEITPGKMAICSFFLQDACTKEDCPYRHEKLAPDAELCKAFVQGYCPHGKDCKKAHILICSKFLRGLCDKGKDCTFPHPVKKEKSSNAKSSDDNQKKDEFQLETVLRYFESNPQESSTRGLVVPRIKSLPEQPAFISLTMDETS